LLYITAQEKKKMYKSDKTSYSVNFVFFEILSQNLKIQKISR
jgi:hypothetical protein